MIASDTAIGAVRFNNRIDAPADVLSKFNVESYSLGRQFPAASKDRVMTNRRFPPPWIVEDIGACFVVKDSSGQKLAYVYFEEDPGRRSSQVAH